ncbi:acyl-CoA synthetase [Undibacterium terreum]|uniref:Acyl-CoA synthetase n=1 Tax=Undibacterium terreum TaxID=1224302 RepID=A0A916XFR4_9BURK|nr:acyl-CoA synthetase [Undibacterium terreum]GGC68847.1 acyl-CoA synthetase [Undibacterium terreum]
MNDITPPRILAGDRQRLISDITQRAAQAATGFAQLGIGEDDVVALLMRNDFAFFEASLAASMIGAYATPINWHATAAEAEYVLSDSSAKVLVVHTDLWPAVAAGVPAHITVLFAPTPPEILRAYKASASATDLPPAAVLWDDWIANYTARTSPPPDMRGVMIYTSGTTGKPKGVRRNPLNAERFAIMSAATSAAYGLTTDQPMWVLMNGPMYHSAPNSYGITSARLGSNIVLQERFDPEQMLALIEQHRITHMHIVPTMFYRLLQLPEEIKHKYDLSSLKDVVHGAAPCPPALKQAMIAWWGPVISEYYGSTETGLIARNTSADALSKPGTVGKPIPGARIKIFDDEGRDLPPGAVGDVYVHIAHMPDFTYHKQADKRQAAGRNGFVTVGDMGWLDEDGYLFLSDRKNDMVISGGVNIYPAEIEAVLLGIPGVKDCAVFGIPDQEFGEQLCAYVQREENAASLSADEIRAQLAQHLAKFKVPKLIKFADTLPREDSGKIFKRKLRAPYWESANRKI